MAKSDSSDSQLKRQRKLIKTHYCQGFSESLQISALRQRQPLMSQLIKLLHCEMSYESVSGDGDFISCVGVWSSEFFIHLGSFTSAKSWRKKTPRQETN